LDTVEAQDMEDCERECLERLKEEEERDMVSREAEEWKRFSRSAAPSACSDEDGFCAEMKLN